MATTATPTPSLYSTFKTYERDVHECLEEGARQLGIASEGREFIRTMTAQTRGLGTTRDLALVSSSSVKLARIYDTSDMQRTADKISTTIGNLNAFIGSCETTVDSGTRINVSGEIVTEDGDDTISLQDLAQSLKAVATYARDALVVMNAHLGDRVSKVKVEATSLVGFQSWGYTESVPGFRSPEGSSEITQAVEVANKFGLAGSITPQKIDDLMINSTLASALQAMSVASEKSEGTASETAATAAAAESSTTANLTAVTKERDDALAALEKEKEATATAKKERAAALDKADALQKELDDTKGALAKETENSARVAAEKNAALAQVNPGLARIEALEKELATTKAALEEATKKK